MTRRSAPFSTAGGLLRLVLLTGTALLAFAANSVLCRLALKNGGMGPAEFTAVRIVTGAGVLWMIVMLRGMGRADRQKDTGGVRGGGWMGAMALFTYALAFSLAYVSLSTGTGALLLFGAVQITMIAWGLRSGERMSGMQAGGLVLAVSGIVLLLSPGLSAPPLKGALLMIGSGVAWGVYSLLGRRVADPLAATCHNFTRAVPLALGAAVLGGSGFHWYGAGMGYAALSGGLASGMGYAIWYAALGGLSATRAATVQLAVPVIAALGGVVWLTESVSPRLAAASLLTLGGIALVVRKQGRGG